MLTEVTFPGTNVIYSKCLNIYHGGLFIWLGWGDVNCKYWCLSVGLICKFLVRLSTDKLRHKFPPAIQFYWKLFKGEDTFYRRRGNKDGKASSY